MSEQLRFIVSELRKHPWEKDFSIISFDSLSSEQVLQVLTDVLAEIDPRNRVDIQEETPEKMAVRMLSMLRAIKYRPPDSIAKNFRRSLVEGDKGVVCSILQWILEKPVAELKRRAYLAKYLVKVEVPPEVMYDPEAAALYQQYEGLVEEFVAVHREWEGVGGGDSSVGASVGERRNDVAAMQREREQVVLWLQRMKAKVDGVSGAEALLSATRSLRLERVRAGEQSAQREAQMAGAARAEESVARLRRELAQARSDAKNASATGLLRRLEEELRLSSYLASEKLPAEVARLVADVDIMRHVAATQPAPSAQDLDALRDTLAALTREISAVARPQPVAALRDIHHEEEGDEQLAPLRQQCALAVAARAEADERLAEARAALQELEEEEAAAAARGGNRSGAARGRPSCGGEVRRRLQAELGVVVRTLEVLRRQQQQQQEEEEEAIVQQQQRVQLMSYEDGGDRKSVVDASGSDVAALQRELCVCREQYQESKAGLEKRRRARESVASAVEAQVNNAEQEVRERWAECVRLRRERAAAEARLRVIAEQRQRLHAEEKQKHSSASNATLRERLSAQAGAEEREARRLSEEQRALQGAGPKARRLNMQWTHLHSLLELKRKTLETPIQVSETVHREKGSETLVLP